MSTINQFKNLSRFCIFLLFLNSLCGCFESKSGSAPLGFEQTQLSYFGTTPRNLGLKFNLQGNDERTVEAIVILPENLDFKNQKLRYRWQLDEGVEIVEGQRVGEITMVTSDIKIEVLLKVRNFDIDSKKFIRFEASSIIGKNRFFIDGMVSSRSESSFENFVHGIENYKKKVNWNDEK